MIRSNQPETTVLGPEHAGLRISAAEFERAYGVDGYRFELIDGVVETSPSPDPYAQDIAVAVQYLLFLHRAPDGSAPFAHVTREPRVFLPDADAGATVPQPDVAAYVVYPPKPVASYRDTSPALVVEIVTAGSGEKDYVRNRELYAKSPDIVEYWVIDPSKDRAKPSMTVFHRTDSSLPFARVDIVSGGAYVCRRWPGLIVDLSRIAVE